MPSTNVPSFIQFRLVASSNAPNKTVGDRLTRQTDRQTDYYVLSFRGHKNIKTNRKFLPLSLTLTLSVTLDYLPGLALIQTPFLSLMILFSLSTLISVTGYRNGAIIDVNPQAPIVLSQLTGREETELK